MSTVGVIHDREAIRAELEAVLKSEAFSRSPSLAHLLRYICEKTLAGDAARIKEYNIAVEAFGRQPNFDQKSDAIVRVEAYRLRKRLKLYYEKAGADHAIHITVPAGQYVPVFLPNTPSASEAQALASAPELEAAPPDEAAVEPAPEAVCPETPPPAELGPQTEADFDTPPEDQEPARPSEAAAPMPPEPVAAAASPSTQRRRFLPVAVAAGLVVAAAGLSTWLTRSGDGEAAVSASAAVVPTLPDEEGIRIAAGMTAPKYVDSTGELWVGDQHFEGGAAASEPNRIVLRTPDPMLYRSRRQGDFRYKIPLKPAVYELHLYFSEPIFGPGNIGGGGESSRLFHVRANGRDLLTDFDVVSDAGGSDLANERVFKNITPGPDGVLDLHFEKMKEGAVVNGIAVLPGIKNGMRPVRIVAASGAQRDSKGRHWLPDRYSLGGQAVDRSKVRVTGDEPDLYRGERYGHFTYTIPVPDGKYSATLRFAETWFGPQKPARGGEGSRIFDVYCNGVTLLRKFDVFKAAGGSDRAVLKTFRGLTPNAQGKLRFAFVPVKNYSMVNAIEVVSMP